MFKRKREKGINRKGSIRDAIVAHCSKLENSHWSIWFVCLATAIQIVKILYICLWVGFCTDYVYIYIFNAQERQLGASSNPRAFFFFPVWVESSLLFRLTESSLKLLDTHRKKKKKKCTNHILTTFVNWQETYLIIIIFVGDSIHHVEKSENQWKALTFKAFSDCIEMALATKFISPLCRCFLHV